MSSSTAAVLVPASDEMEFDPESPFAETIRNLKREREEVQDGKHSTLPPTSFIHVMFSRSLPRLLLLCFFRISSTNHEGSFWFFFFIFKSSAAPFFLFFFLLAQEN
jgi:hypothetical protein